ncbi:putative Calcium-binding EF-hand family protein [Hibiscus syriacus]|uniref:Calcium-binding EF-hand family protein n=1 Tax=Hibiscus syriacus TaxID=106335 RepID=A0A6A2ZCZ1_HIBSY|nr:putative Calcium-binding EF-hand family protein [Hibiscus syriacus]
MDSLNVDKRCRRKGGKKKEDWSPNDPPVDPINVDQVMTIFKRFDLDRNGRLSKEELKKASSSLGLRFQGRRALRAGLHHADANNNGLISEEEQDTQVKYATERSYEIKMY